MFNCAKCHQTIGPNIPERKIVVETRQRVYVSEHGKTSRGSEIVQEISVCEPCETKSSTVKAQ